jgi:hypothetical protein
MSLQEAPSQPSNSAPAVQESREVKPGRVNEYKSGNHDPFTAAFNSAKDEIEGESKPRAEAKPKPKAEKKPEDPAEEKKSAPKPPKKAQEAPQAEEEDEGDEGEEEVKASPAPSKGPLEPKRFWSKERKEAFRFQPRDVQESWLDEEPAANERWPTEIKEDFAKLPREGKEIFLSQVGELERGYNQKFQALAAERKLADDIRNAVPAHMRSYMQQRGLSEPQVLSKLLGYQQQAMTDPKGYVRQFIVQNKLNPLEILGIDQNGQPVSQAASPQQADVQSHPAFQALMAEHEALRRSVQAEQERRAQEESRRGTAEFEEIVSEVDGDGNSLYPYIRLLSDPMARIIESDPELFGSMDVKDRLATAYRMALQDYPELMPAKRTAKPQPADEPEEDAHTAEEQKRAAKLEKAITPKSRTHQPAPKTSKSGDPFDDAWNSALKQLNR